MSRLKSTKDILQNNLQTVENLLVRTDRGITKDYHRINIIRGSIKRTSQPKTFKKIQQRMIDLAIEMGHHPPAKANKAYLLYKLKDYIKKNTFLRYAAIRQSTINICVIYEDFIHRVIMKYYEENIMRIPDKKETLKNKDIVDALLRGDNLHHVIAQKLTDNLMYGSTDSWDKQLEHMGMVLPHSEDIKELFLIRNCLIHNNNRVSHELHQFNPTRYPIRSVVRLSIKDVFKFKSDVDSYSNAIIQEYTRLFPVNGGSWVGTPFNI